jgi:cytochrome P450 family 9
MRNRLSPTFTTSKLRGMFPLIDNCGKQFAHFIVTRPEASTAPIEFLDAFTRFSNDVIATVAFGHECNAVNNPKEQFYVLGQEIMNVGFKRFLTLFGHLLIPKVMDFFHIPLLPKQPVDYFRQLIFGTMKYREQHGLVSV